MHDRNGTPLKIGDVVLVPMTITDISQADDYCNVSMKSVAGRRPDGMKESVSAVNTGVVVLYEKA